MKNVGIVLIIVGAVMTVFTGFNILTKKKVLDLGSVEITSTEKTPVYWSPVTGVVIILIGGLLVLANKKNLSK